MNRRTNRQTNNAVSRVAFATENRKISTNYVSCDCRYRRDVLEGTINELILPKDENFDLYSITNTTNIDLVKRQAEFPGNEDTKLDKSKYGPE